MLWDFSKSLLVCSAAAAWLISSWAAAQAPNSSNLKRDFGTQEPIFQAKSNLVLVPVFVFTHDGLERLGNPQESRCMKEEDEAFLGLSAHQPYLPKLCDRRQVDDLTLDDFALFQDGKPQKINSLEKELWWLPVRDNRTWHFEDSDTPNGAWSSADLDQSIGPGTDSFYLLGYTPTMSDEGCHRIRVEVHRLGVRIFAREEYCTGQSPSDLLNATKIGEKLERELDRKRKGKIPLFVQAGAFHSGANQQFVDVAVEFPWSQLNHSWNEQTGRLRASITVLGAVFSKDGKLVSRFSDLLWPSYWPTIARGWQSDIDYLNGLGLDQRTVVPRVMHTLLKRQDPAVLPSRYETQLELAPGEYDLRIVLSDGAKVGRAEIPLTIQKDDAKSLSVGSVLLCKRFRDAHVAAVETRAANFAPQYAPLVSKGIRVTPAGDTDFKTGEPLIPYFEIYAPKADGNHTAQIQAHLRIVDAKTGAIPKEFPPVDVATYMVPGSTTIPIAREVPIAGLPKGQYRLEIRATDSAGRSTPWKTAKFSIGGEK
jgi:hypothetical protein